MIYNQGFQIFLKKSLSNYQWFTSSFMTTKGYLKFLKQPKLIVLDFNLFKKVELTILWFWNIEELELEAINKIKYPSDIGDYL